MNDLCPYIFVKVGLPRPRFFAFFEPLLKNIATSENQTRIAGAEN